MAKLVTSSPWQKQIDGQPELTKHIVSQLYGCWMIKDCVMSHMYKEFNNPLSLRQTRQITQKDILKPFSLSYPKKSLASTSPPKQSSGVTLSRRSVSTWPWPWHPGKNSWMLQFFWERVYDMYEHCLFIKTCIVWCGSNTSGNIVLGIYCCWYLNGLCLLKTAGRSSVLNHWLRSSGNPPEECLLSIVIHWE